MRTKHLEQNENIRNLGIQASFVGEEHTARAELQVLIGHQNWEIRLTSLSGYRYFNFALKKSVVRIQASSAAALS